MKERIEKKLKELEESYELQENILRELQIKIMLLKEILDEE